MIQQGSMPPVSANLLAALVGSLQMPPAMIIPATGAAAPVAVSASFPTLPLPSAQAFSGVLVDQLAAAIARAGNIPSAPLASVGTAPSGQGGTAPPQVASPPLWAATAPSGLADAGVSPGQQVVDQTGTSAGGVRSASALLISQLPARVASSLPSVAVTMPPLADRSAVPAPRALPDVAPMRSAPTAVSPVPVPVAALTPVERAPAPANAPAASIARGEVSRPAAGPAWRDQAAEQVQAIVATLAHADTANQPSIESLRTTLLSALTAIDPARSAEATRVVRGLAAAVAPTGSASAVPRQDAASPLVGIAAVIRAANPEALVAIVRRAEAGAPVPAADASAPGRAIVSAAAPAPQTSMPAAVRMAAIEPPASIGVAMPTPQAVTLAPAPAQPAGGRRPVVQDSVPTFAALRNIALTVAGPAPRPAPATPPAVSPASDTVLAAAVRAYDATQPDAAPVPVAGVMTAFDPQAGVSTVNVPAASSQPDGSRTAAAPRTVTAAMPVAPGVAAAHSSPERLSSVSLGTPSVPSVPSTVPVAAIVASTRAAAQSAPSPALAVTPDAAAPRIGSEPSWMLNGEEALSPATSSRPAVLEPVLAGQSQVAVEGRAGMPALAPQAAGEHPVGLQPMAAGPRPVPAGVVQPPSDLAVATAPLPPAAAAVMPVAPGSGQPAPAPVAVLPAPQPVPAEVAGLPVSLVQTARGPAFNADASTVAPRAAETVPGPAVAAASASPVGDSAVQPAVAAPASPIDVPRVAAAGPATPVLIAAPAASPRADQQAGLSRDMAMPESGAASAARTGATDTPAAARPVVPAGPGAVTQPSAVAAAGVLEAGARGGAAAGLPERDQQAGESTAPLAAASVPAGASASGSHTALSAPVDGGRGAAVTAAMAQVAQESAQTQPGTVRNVDLRLTTNELGTVRVRLSVDHAGAVRIEVRAATEQAAQALRGGVPQLAEALAARNLSLNTAAVQVMNGAEFGGSNQPRQQPRWHERARKPGPGAADAGGPVLAGIGAAAYGRQALAGVDVFA